MQSTQPVPPGVLELIAKTAPHDAGIVPLA
jgi:hypothetical protein